MWLDFIDEPQDSPRRTRNGIYESYYIGESKTVKVILLDNRFNRDTRPLFGFWWDEDHDMLGEEQWLWLAEELKNNKAKYILIGNGSQLLPDDRFIPEYWFKSSRDRLLGMLKQYKVSGTILLSGDVHWAEIMSYPCWKRDVGHPLYEVTSSGFTHNLYSGLINKIAEDFWPKTFWEEGNTGAFVGFNFGTIRVLENGGESKIFIEVRDKNGQVVRSKELREEELRFREFEESQYEKCVLEVHPFVRFVWNIVVRLMELEWRVWVCVGVGVGVLLIVAGVGVLGMVVVGYFVKRWRKNKEKSE